MRHTSGSFAQVLTSIPALRPLYSSLHSICFSRGLVAAIQRFFTRNMGERRFHLLQCPAATYNGDFICYSVLQRPILSHPLISATCMQGMLPSRC